MKCLFRESHCPRGNAIDNRVLQDERKDYCIAFLGVIVGSHEGASSCSSGGG